MKRQGRLFYGWVLAGASQVTLFVVYGNRYSFSIFYPVILREFGWSRGDTALIFSINIISYGLTAIVAGALTDRFGPRRVLPAGAVLLILGLAASSQMDHLWQFYLLAGMAAAVGTCGVGFVPHTVMLSQWFVRRRGTVFSILSVGSSAAFLMGWLANYLVGVVGWRGAYLALAGLVTVVVLPLVLLFPRHRPQDMGLTPDGLPLNPGGDPPTPPPLTTPWTLPRALRSPLFWGLFGSYFCLWGTSWYLVIPHQVAFAQDLGFSPLFAASVFSLYGVAFALGTALGFLGDLWGRKPVFTLGTAGGMMGIGALLLLRDSSQPWLFYLYLLGFGTGMGLASPSLIAAIADRFGGRHFGSIYGFIMFGFGFGGALGAWLGGFIYDLAGSYYTAFGVAGISLALSLVLFWLTGGRGRPKG